MSRHRNVTTAIALLFLAAPLAAQGISPTAPEQHAAPVIASAPAATPQSAVDRAPSVAPARIGVPRDISASAPAPALLPSLAQSDSRSPAMMIVGGAALIVGAVVGGKAGTVIMVGGGVLGLVGLWKYLN
jgi:hypothetical protein